jgi:hypothetical protein
VLKINQEFAKSLSSFSESRPGDSEDHEIELLLQEDAKEQPEVTAKPDDAKDDKQPCLVRIEKVAEAPPTVAELYAANDEEEQHLEDEDEAIFDDKEIYDIMEIENNYVDEAGNAILTRDDDDDDDDDDAQFILVNYKSGDEFGTDKEQRYIVEEMEGDEKDDDKPTRKKNMKRMPRELIEKYAQSTDNNQHMCTKCVKIFSTRTNLIRHIQSHDGNKVRIFGFFLGFFRIF